MKKFKKITRLLKSHPHHRNGYSGTMGYYQLTVFDRYTNLRSLMKIVCQSKSSNACTTITDIKFKGAIEFGTDESQVIKTLGNPLVYFKNPTLEYHTVIFYKCYIGSFKTNLEVHFYDGKFFMGVYSFNGINNDTDKRRLRKILHEKYKVTRKAPDDKYPVIIDKHGNTVMINDFINYSYIYISGDEEIIGDLKNNIEQVVSFVKKKERRIARHIESNL